MYEPIIFFQSRPGADPTFLKEATNRGTQTQRLNFKKILFRTGGGRNATLFNDIVIPMVYV